MEQASHSIQCEWVPFEVMGKVSDYRQTWMTDWLTDCPTDHCVHTSHLLVSGNKHIFLCLEQQQSSCCTDGLEIKEWDWQEYDQNKIGRHQGQAVTLRGGKVAHRSRPSLCSRELESCCLFKVTSFTLASAR